MESPATCQLWVAACAHHLHRRWRTIAPAQLEEVAADLARDPRLRTLAPDEAAVRWLKPGGSEHGDRRQEGVD